MLYKEIEECYWCGDKFEHEGDTNYDWMGEFMTCDKCYEKQVQDSIDYMLNEELEW